MLVTLLMTKQAYPKGQTQAASGMTERRRRSSGEAEGTFRLYQFAVTGWMQPVTRREGFNLSRIEKFFDRETCRRAPFVPLGPERLGANGSSRLDEPDGRVRCGCVSEGWGAFSAGIGRCGTSSSFGKGSSLTS
jgi:hypothetical protein